MTVFEEGCEHVLDPALLRTGVRMCEDVSLIHTFSQDDEDDE